VGLGKDYTKIKLNSIQKYFWNLFKQQTLTDKATFYIFSDRWR